VPPQEMGSLLSRVGKVGEKKKLSWTRDRLGKEGVAVRGARKPKDARRRPSLGVGKRQGKRKVKFLNRGRTLQVGSAGPKKRVFGRCGENEGKQRKKGRRIGG